MPRHHLTGRNILDHRKIRIHAIEWQIGDVGAEYCTWYGLIECPLELVGECPVLQSFLHNRFVWVSSSYFGEKIVLSHESQENTANHEKVRSSHQSKKKKPIQSDYEEKTGAQDIPQQAPKGIQSNHTKYSILHRHHLSAIQWHVCVSFGDQGYCDRLGGGVASIIRLGDDAGDQNNQTNGRTRRRANSFRSRIPLHQSVVH